MNHTVTSIDALSAVRFHCEHADGSISLAIGDDLPTTIYLNGSPAMLRDFARTIATAARAYDRQEVTS